MADTDLSDSVASLQYLVARPGTFDTFYPETTDDMVTAVLQDGLAEAQLMGLLSTFTAEDEIVTPGLTKAQIALVVLFSAVRFMRAELFNRNTSVTYKAGSADYETVQATNILRDILKALEAQKGAVIDLLGTGSGAAAAFYMADQYLARAWEPSYVSSYPMSIGW